MKKLAAFIVVGVLTVLSQSAYAAIDLTGFDVDLVPLETMMGVIVVAMGVMYGIRKLIKTGNRT